MSQTMTRLQNQSPAEHSTLTRILFGQLPPTTTTTSSPASAEKEIDWINPSLNASQKAALGLALSGSRAVTLVHGPPGTGKTQTLVELVLQLLRRGLRVLVCGPSNVAVDGVVERLAAAAAAEGEDKDKEGGLGKGMRMVRLGHPARLLPGVLQHCLDVLSRGSEEAEIVREVGKEIEGRLREVGKTRNGAERRRIWADVRELRREFREREREVVARVVRGARVVLATLHGAGGRELRGERFDVLVVDEASQALEAQCWVPLLGCGAERLVLAGDHLQLPPTIKSGNSRAGKRVKMGKDEEGGEDADDEKSAGMESEGAGDVDKQNGGEVKAEKKEERISLETTLFDRLLALHGHSIKRMLTTQYRMHEKIMAFPSAALYENKLVAADAVRSHLLTDLPYPVSATDDTREPLVFWDTQGGDFPERAEEEEEGLDGGGGGGKARFSLLGDSKSNEREAAVVGLH
ncbi:hypothetical protein LTR28_013869, partial [Elasticomyces elasticus]